MLSFDLRTSPFYLLGVSLRDTGAAIADAVEVALSDGRLDETVAIRAQQALMSPRLRLSAELSWLPGVAPNRTRELIENELPESLTDLPPLAAANVAAHRCAANLEPRYDSLVLRFYGQRDDGALLALLNSERRVAGFPEIPHELLSDALPNLEKQHVDALAHAIITGESPSQSLIDILKKNANSDPHAVGFLDDVVERFDAWAIPQLVEAEKAISECLGKIENDAASVDLHLSHFSSAIAKWASLASPRQHTFAKRHIKDQRTEDLLSAIRSVCLHFNNDLHDSRTPLALTRAALPAFAESPEHLERIKSDLETLEELTSSGDALKVVEPLSALISRLNNSHSEICLSLKRYGFGEAAKGVAGDLFRLFKSAAIQLAGTPAAMAPFRMILSLAIDLHNDSSASDEALILVAALQIFRDVPTDVETAARLKANGLIIYRTALQKQLSARAQAKQHTRCARIAKDLEDASDNADEKAGWTKLRREFERRTSMRRWTYGAIAAGVLGFIGYSSLVDTPSQSTSNSRIASQTPAAPSVIPDNSSRAQALFELGVQNIKNHQLGLAVGNFSQAIALAPNYPAAFVGRGYAHAMDRHFDEAVKDYSEAIRLDPADASAFGLRGKAYADQGQYDIALPDFSHAIDLSPDYSVALIGRGSILASRHQYDLAIRDYDQAIRSDPTSAYAFALRGRTYAEQGLYDTAIRNFDQALSLSSNYVYALALRGSAYSRSAQFDAAIRDFNRVVDLAPEAYGGFVGRSLAFLAQGNLQQAISDCNQVIRLEPNRKEFLENRGLVYLRGKQIELALADFNEALRFNPKLPWSLFARGIIKLRRGDISGGRADMQSAQAIQADVAIELQKYGVRP